MMSSLFITSWGVVRCRLVVVREVTQEKERQHVVAEVIRIHRAAQLVGDAPERAAQLFLVGVGHQLILNSPFLL